MPDRTMVVKIGKNADFDLHFQIERSPIADLWVERMLLRDRWPMDNPDRFYGFDDFESETRRALTLINSNIDIINDHRPLIDRRLTSVNDQDTLNYLHNIFEKFHGQLDQQGHEFWDQCPDAVRQALADLNINVHRCESLRGGKMLPRFVCTWYGMPKTHALSQEIKQRHGTEGSVFGGVYLNYVEIGKTAQDMAYDDDQYMADDMFQPFNHYSADFRVDFYDDSQSDIDFRRQKTSSYFQKNLDFFSRFGISSADDVRIKPIKFKVAQLMFESNDKEYIISQIRERQYVSSVILQ